MKLVREVLLASVASLAFLAPAAAQPPATLQTTVTDVDGVSTRYHVAGLETRRPGMPVVILFNGALSSLEAWDRVLRQLDDSIPRVAYDRPGAGRSAPIQGVLTPQRTSAHLDALLKHLDIRPPFVIVGWSWGGPLALDFASRHPGAVVGTVLLDPTIIGVSEGEQRAMLISLGATPADVDVYYARGKQETSQMLARLPARVRSELEALEFADSLDIPFPRVPTTVLLAGRMQPGFTRGTLPAGIDEGAFFRAERAQAEASVQARLQGVPATVLRVLPQSTHTVPQDAPEIVVQEIMRVWRLCGC
jgi:pimeloyl-ACP methyl ester carboxylesterase